MTTRYVIHARIAGVYEQFRSEYISGVQGTALFRDVSDGWFVSLRDTRASVYVGNEKPDLEIGDVITITIEKKVIE